MKRIFFSFYLFVLLTLIVVSFGLSPILDKIATATLKRDIDAYFVNLIRGPYFVTMKYLESVPSDKIPETIESLKPEFGFPIASVALNAIQLSATERQSLESGKIVTRDEWSMFYQRIGDTQWVIAMGPLKDFDEEFNFRFIKPLFWGSLLCFIALLSLIWALPFWKNLKRLMDAATDFGSGRFDIRAEVGKRSPLKPMADTFNQMAIRIGGLIQSHKLLVNAVSHELRTPISRIRFGLQMLESSDNKEKPRYLNGISEDIDDLEDLVSELLTYARFDQDTQFLNIQKIDAKKWLPQQIERVQHLSAEKLVDIDLSGCPPCFEADPRFLGRAMENVLVNAIKYAGNRILVSAAKRGKNMEISISDDGPGIPEKDMERIFNPFVRVDESRDRSSGGYGLGLAIVSQIMTRHGGTAKAYKSDMGGACLIISWPLKRQNRR